MIRSLTLRLSALSLIIAASLASAATVRRSDDSVIKGEIVAIRDGALVLEPAAVIPLDDVAEVSFDNTPPVKTTAPTTKPVKGSATRPSGASATQPSAPGGWRVALHNGDALHLTAPTWTGGRLRGVLVGSDAALDLPVNVARELWIGPSDRVQAARALNEKPGADDIAYAQRDAQVLAVRGVALGLNEAGDALRFKFGTDERSIALNRLIGVVFAHDAGAAPTPASAPLQQVATLSAGHTISGAWTSVDEKTIGFTTHWGQSLTFPRTAVSKIATRNGRVTSLSDLLPSSVEQTPYFDRLLGWQIDRSLDGKPLVLSDGPCPRGIAVHARTTLTYDIGGAFDQFRSKVGFQQPEGKLGEAVVRLLGDGKVLFEKPDARGDAPPFEINVSVQGVRRLTLQVDFGEGQDVGDRVVWGSARLLRSAAR